MCGTTVSHFFHRYGAKRKMSDHFVFASPCTIEHRVLLHSFKQIGTVMGKMHDPEVTKISHIYTFNKLC